jgi:hypothetical protein
VEYVPAFHMGSGVDPGDLPWTRYRPGFDSPERAANEVLWLSIDSDSHYVFRIVEEPNDY